MEKMYYLDWSTDICNTRFNADKKQIHEFIQHNPKIKQWDTINLYMGTYFINIDDLQCRVILKSIRDIHFGYL